MVRILFILTLSFCWGCDSEALLDPYQKDQALHPDSTDNDFPSDSLYDIVYKDGFVLECGGIGGPCQRLELTSKGVFRDLQFKSFLDLSIQLSVPQHDSVLTWFKDIHLFPSYPPTICADALTYHLTWIHGDGSADLIRNVHTCGLDQSEPLQLGMRTAISKVMTLSEQELGTRVPWREISSSVQLMSDQVRKSDSLKFSITLQNTSADVRTEYFLFSGKVLVREQYTGQRSWGDLDCRREPTCEIQTVRLQPGASVEIVESVPVSAFLPTNPQSPSQFYITFWPNGMGERGQGIGAKVQLID